MAANGLLYTASFSDVAITNAVQDIFEIAAAAGIPLIVHSVRLTFVPTIVSGVAQDVRAKLQIVTRTTAGSGGTAVTPAPENPRNTVAAACTVNRTVVTTQGTLGVVKNADQVSTILPYERIFTPDQRIPIQGGGRLCLFLATALGASYQASGEVYFEEV
jgi:hypothetical protein